MSGRTEGGAVPPTYQPVAGCAEAELAALLGELEGNRVFSRDRHGRIYSRRMIADACKARVAPQRPEGRQSKPFERKDDSGFG